MKRKTFEHGETVEVQREVGASWEPATYDRMTGMMRAWHRVKLPEGKEQRVDSMTGMECGEDNPRGFLTPQLLVPSQRIRKVGTR